MAKINYLKTEKESKTVLNLKKIFWRENETDMTATKRANEITNAFLYKINKI